MRLALLLACLLWASPAWATITRVNATVGSGVGSSFTVATAAWSATAGNTIVLIIRANDAGVAMTSVLDTALNTYTLVDSSTATDPSMFMYVAKNITGNAVNVVTATFTAGHPYLWIYAIEYSGLHATTPVDTQDHKTGTGVTDLVTNAFSTAQASEVVLVGASQNDFAVYTAGTDFSLIDGSIGAGAYGGLEEYITSGTLTTHTAHITSTKTAQYTTVTGAFKAAAGGATPVRHRAVNQ